MKSKSENTCYFGINKFDDTASALLKQELTKSLALYILANSKKPISTVIEELNSVEIEASRMISIALESKLSKRKAPDLKGVLVRVFSFIFFPARS